MHKANKIEKASEMQQPSCKSKSFGQTGFLFSRFINVMCQVSIFWHCWYSRRRFLNFKIINHFMPPLWTPKGPSLDPRHTEHNFGRGRNFEPKEHWGKVWLKLTKWFQRYVQFLKKLPVGDGDDPGPQLLGHLICLFTLIIHIYGLRVGISTIIKFTPGRGWGMTPQGLSYKAFNFPSHPDHKYIWFRGGDLNR